MNSIEPPFFKTRLELHQEDCIQHGSFSFCSHVGFYGDNVLKPSLKVPWFKEWTGKSEVSNPTGKTSLGTAAMYSSMRCTQDREYRNHPARRVEIGMVITFLPQDVTTEVNPSGMDYKSFFRSHARRKRWFQSDHRRSICSDCKNHPAKGVCGFNAQVIIMNCSGQVAAGYTRMVDCHSTNNVICPSYLCVELFTDNSLLGCFAIRDIRLTAAMGVMKSLAKPEGALGEATKAAWTVGVSKKK
ncbi:unnamed protein product [Angiostrongylus costaricensis]|uniref:START domain-containing protein n=1 Tax=Angiostrongylus costaricensis TaxID=334426 RepID=A0A0R3PDA7_ANGCS|nr:unnamed protein product [Angiostrongylus costaricensis]